MSAPREPGPGSDKEWAEYWEQMQEWLKQMPKAPAEEVEVDDPDSEPREDVDGHS